MRSVFIGRYNGEAMSCGRERERRQLIAEGGGVHQHSPCLGAGGVPSRIPASLQFRREDGCRQIRYPRQR